MPIHIAAAAAARNRRFPGPLRHCTARQIAKGAVIPREAARNIGCPASEKTRSLVLKCGSGSSPARCATA